MLPCSHEAETGREEGPWRQTGGAVRDNAVEMDAVVGRSGKGEQCILTLFLRRIGFQFCILLPRKTARCAVEAVDTLLAVCGPRFPQMFGLVITDRGPEFSDVERIEHGKNGVKRLSLYFCDPMQSQQKGRAERCHEELRRILPKGKTDFDALTRRDMAACTSHVNSYLRGNMERMAPVEMAGPVLPPGVLDAYGVEAVDPREVNLRPQLVPHSVARL